MPGNMCDIVERSGNGGVDERTLQLAFELSMLGLDDLSTGMMGSAGGAGEDRLDGAVPGHVGLMASAAVEEARSKKSQNMTECVPVPSSEHVAEIVGRQGCKIKALRAKTNTYIKTPVRGEEPVFVVTGRKEDVAKAKREILSAAEHFSQIRASRKNNLGGLLGGLSPPGPPANVPGQITILVRVPYRVVGLVVGPKGATIKRIQQQTHTYIVTPSRDKEPMFEVSGLPENVHAAKREIEAHIALRTGVANLGGAAMTDLGAPLLEDNAELLASLYKTGLGSLLNCLDPTEASSAATADALGMFPAASLTSSASSGAFSSSGSLSSTSSSSSTGGRLGDLVSIWSPGLERDEGIGESPGFETAPPSSSSSSNIWSFPSPASATGTATRPSPAASASPTDSLPGMAAVNLVGSKRDCVVCGDKEVNAALVPCGHNLFCLDCASRLCDGLEPTCPICSRTVCQAIRILS